jgi:hypothetical protein
LAKLDKLLYNPLTFSAEVISQVHERHPFLGEWYVDRTAPFWEGRHNSIQGLCEVARNRTWDDVWGRDGEVVGEARYRLPPK